METNCSRSGKPVLRGVQKLSWAEAPHLVFMLEICDLLRKASQAPPDLNIISHLTLKTQSQKGKGLKQLACSNLASQLELLFFSARGCAGLLVRGWLQGPKTSRVCSAQNNH